MLTIGIMLMVADSESSSPLMLLYITLTPEGPIAESAEIAMFL